MRSAIKTFEETVRQYSPYPATIKVCEIDGYAQPTLSRSANTTLEVNVNQILLDAPESVLKYVAARMALFFSPDFNQFYPNRKQMYRIRKILDSSNKPLSPPRTQGPYWNDYSSVALDRLIEVKTPYKLDELIAEWLTSHRPKILGSFSYKERLAIAQNSDTIWSSLSPGDE